jgi:hypothetical protein
MDFIWLIMRPAAAESCADVLFRMAVSLLLGLITLGAPPSVFSFRDDSVRLLQAFNTMIEETSARIVFMATLF